MTEAAYCIVIFNDATRQEPAAVTDTMNLYCAYKEQSMWRTYGEKFVSIVTAAQGREFKRRMMTARRERDEEV